MGRVRHRVLVENRNTYVHEDSVEILRPFFTYKKPGYFFTVAFKCGAWDGNTCLLKNGIIPTGAFLAVRATIEKAGILLDIHDKRTAPVLTSRKLQGGINPHEYQQTCVDKMVKASATGGLVLNATGTGKTFIAAMYFSILKGAGFFVVDEKLLAAQTIKELETLLGETVGFIGDGKWKPQRITVCLIQSLDMKRGRQEFDAWAALQEVAFIDEIHMAVNDRTRRVLEAIGPKTVFGLTATLALEKKQVSLEAYGIAGPVLFEFPYNEALLQGVLAPGVVVGVDLLRSHPAKGVDYKQLYRWFVVDSDRRNNLIADLAREGVRRGNHVVILVDLPGHVRLLSKLLKDVPHNTVFGARSTKHRVASKERFEEGEKSLIIANRVFKKGINIKILDVIIDGAGLPNPDDALQKFGRGVRLLSGKAGLLYFDVGDKRPKNARYKANRFATSCRRRRKAFKTKLKVLVESRLAKKFSPSELFDLGETLLASVVKNPTA